MSASREQERDWLIRRLTVLQEENFFGKIVIALQRGHICYIRTETTEKPPGDRENATQKTSKETPPYGFQIEEPAEDAE